MRFIYLKILVLFFLSCKNNESSIDKTTLKDVAVVVQKIKEDKETLLYNINVKSLYTLEETVQNG